MYTTPKHAHELQQHTLEILNPQVDLSAWFQKQSHALIQPYTINAGTVSLTYRFSSEQNKDLHVLK
jgi:hypothetical protein